MRCTRHFGAVVALATAAAVLTPQIDAAAVGSRRAPVPATSDAPAARIAQLSALVGSRDAARATELVDRQLAVQQLADAHLAENAALANADMLGRAAVAAAARYRNARAQVATLASAYYTHAGNSGPLVRMLESHSAAEYGYRKKIVSVVGERQAKVVKQMLHARNQADVAARDAGTEAQRLHARVTKLAQEIPAHDARLDGLQAGLSRARFWLARWQSIAVGVDTPIMSRSILGPDELAQWFVATRRRGARITVPIAELTRDFIEEGQAAQVRGDIAFAQSILETASFYFPAGGQLTPLDNNFAGMDACDSCATGTAFPDARTGVRAQMQQLRVYADAHLTNSDLNPPAVNPKLDKHSLKGKVTTWNGLTHTWATADAYGDRILEIYEQILGWLTDRAAV
ncbi:MAG: glucosaminidase domain-containing protein [Acidimicrobiia bacterium]